MTRSKQIPSETLVSLRRRLDALPARSPERRLLITETAESYGVSPDALYRALRARGRPHSAHRSDRGKPRRLSIAEMEHYCEIVAALKIRTTNKKGRHLSTTRSIELLEEHGIYTPNGLSKFHPAY